MNKVIIGLALLSLLGCKEITLSVEDVKKPETTGKTLSLEFDFFEAGLFSCKEPSEALETCGSADYDNTPIYCTLSCSEGSPLRYMVPPYFMKYMIGISDGLQTRYIYLLYHADSSRFFEVSAEDYQYSIFDTTRINVHEDIFSEEVIKFEDYVVDLQPLEKIISLKVEGIPR